MALEIERKFLVKGNFRPFISRSIQIEQAYLSTHPARSIRIRIFGEQAFLTIKGETKKEGFTRFEWEKEIQPEEAQQLFKLCENGSIQKVRHQIPFGKHVFEVDEFLGKNEGLIIAEIELSSEDEVFEKPDWLGEEVTFDTRYYNAALLNHPYTKW